MSVEACYSLVDALLGSAEPSAINPSDGQQRVAIIYQDPELASEVERLNRLLADYDRD